MGFSEEMLQFLQRHPAEATAAFLIPFLQPGMRVLDFGCGPGTISTELAKLVAPGELHGVDMEESQIDLARSIASSAGQENAIFHVADATDLPFEDGYFDVAHCYNVLTHIPDTKAVLAEVKRVLKPGGVIGSRERISSSCFSHPDFGIIQKGWDMFGDLLAANDGHPHMGKDLKNQFLQAGFADVKASGSFNYYTTPRDIEFSYNLVMDWFLSPEVMETAINYGASTREMCDEIRLAHDLWKAHPGATVGVAYGEAIGSKT